jgi:hypothetical protein
MNTIEREMKKGMALLASLVAFAGVLGAVRAASAAGVLNQAAACPLTIYPNSFPRPRSVSLAANQTAIRAGQAGRSTCTAFAAVAGIEAAYKRAGFGDLDLSEEFANLMDKMFWLNPNWAEITTADTAETQVGAFSGGGGAGRVEGMAANGFRVPLETVMPYRPDGYDLGAYADWTHPAWRSQRLQSDFNLVGSKPGAFTNSNVLPQAALEAPVYYGVQSCSRVGAKNPEQLEAALASGKEIVWDSNGVFDGAHATLLIGYDRTSPNQVDWYFIAKNSWGEAGYIHIPYRSITAGYDAVTIDSVRTPSQWPELAAIGRWNLSFDGQHGSLDIYHLPGMMQWTLSYYGVTTPDRRIGTFYTSDGRAYRVNGYISGSIVTFYIDWTKPNLRWDELPSTARRFTYDLSAKTVNGRPVMAGFHADPDGSMWGGYAVKAFTPAQQSEWLTGRPDPAGAWRPESFLGEFAFRSTVNRGTLTFKRRKDSILKGGDVGVYAGLVGTFRSDVTRRKIKVKAKVKLADPAQLRIDDMGGQLVFVRKLSHEKGVAAGTSLHIGTYMTRK